MNLKEFNEKKLAKSLMDYWKNTCVDSVSNDVTPNVTLAGAASGLIQKLTH